MRPASPTLPPKPPPGNPAGPGADVLLPLPPGPWMTGRRAAKLFLLALLYAAIHRIESATSYPVWLLRSVIVVLAAALLFAAAERWPARLPGRVARWVWQLLGVAAGVSAGVWLSYGLTTGFDLNLAQEPRRIVGILSMHAFGWLFGPWIALTVMLRQREAFARGQALAFALERSELERQALDARYKLLQAQVQPHFLFNTLANVRALVKAGSPQAPQVLDHLIDYLRAAVPRLDGESTVAQELARVQAYLELMHLRLPDRLRFSVQAGKEVLGLRCLPMSLLTLVENAVRHGIDPAEEGGRIEVQVDRDPQDPGWCRAIVRDTGVGLRDEGSGPGTGLANLRERLRLAFGPGAGLSLRSHPPRGVQAEIRFPARPSTGEAPAA